MDYFATLPVRKYTDKLIAINNSNSEYIGNIRRKYKHAFDKLLNYFPILPFETRNIVGEMNGKNVEIKEHSFKNNLFKLKWDVFIQGESNKFLLEDKTKISTNPRLFYYKNDNVYVFKKDTFNRTSSVCSENTLCAEIKIEKVLPPKIKISLHTDNLSVIEVTAIYYIMNLVY